MPSVHKHSLAVGAREKGHDRGSQAHETARQDGVTDPLQRWATSPKEEEDEFELCNYNLDSAWGF